MKVLYVYPVVFTWDQIVPADYPFIRVHGPKGCEGVLMVFDDSNAYEAFAKAQSKVYNPAIQIVQPEKGDLDGQQDGRNRTK